MSRFPPFPDTHVEVAIYKVKSHHIAYTVLYKPTHAVEYSQTRAVRQCGMKIGPRDNPRHPRRINLDISIDGADSVVIVLVTNDVRQHYF